MLKYLKSINALLVEDEQEIQKSLKESLNYFFNTVYVADDGLDALNLLKSHTIHTVFTDYEMPNMDGYELIKEIRRTDKSLPITIISNHDDREKLQKCIPLGLSGYLFKPLVYSKFKAYLEQLADDFNSKGLLDSKFSKHHTLNFFTYKLKIDQQEHQLTKLEGDFLKLLIELEGKVATFDILYEVLDEFEPTKTTLKNLVYRLKKKYNILCIKSIKDIGYIMVSDV